MKSTELVAINGQVFRPEDAKISVFDRGFLYGDAVYEVARSYNRVFFELEAHMDRMFNSARLIDLDLQKSPEQYCREIYRIYKNLTNENMYMRIQVTRGEGAIGLNTANATQPNVVIYFRRLDPVDPSVYSNGVSIVTTPRLRNTKRALDPNIKSGNYLNNMLAFMDAAKVKAYESIMINSQGLITEGTTSNIFHVKGGTVITPPTDFDILHGITRKIVLRLCRDLNISVHEMGVTPHELENADEVFLTSSTREVLPVQRVNDKVIGAPGSVTRQLADAYKKYVDDYSQRMRNHYGDLILQG